MGLIPFSSFFSSFEHSLLDDDGDGRGTELQLDYLSEELGGRVRAGRKRPPPRSNDGVRTRAILLPMPPEAEPESAKPAEPAS
jgi:hypothetical protein